MEEHGVEAEALQRVPFFRGLSREDVSDILRVGSSASFQPGQPIVRTGEVGDGMYVIVSGSAEVDVGGRYHTLGRGDFFGEMALITAKRRMATVKAVEPVEAMKIPASDFRSLLLQHPRIAVAMLEAIIERLREVEERLDAWMGS